jgi:cell division transport system ATP-binding protein
METICELINADISHKEFAVLRNINLSISKGELVYVIGKTGTGKTTLLKAMYAEIPLKSGSGKVCGYPLESIKNKDIPFLRRRLGIVFQDFQLLTDRTVYENLAFVLKATGWTKKKTIDARIFEVLERVGLQFKGYKMPHELSGGEQQRVVIARAMLNNPDIILADEPTGNLDPETSEGIMKLLLDIRDAGSTVIMATHDYDTLKKFNSRTIICTNNTIIERQNSVIDFMALEQQMDEILEAPAEPEMETNFHESEETENVENIENTEVNSISDEWTLDTNEEDEEDKENEIS